MMDDRLFRNAMGKFATGVTVITTEHDKQEHGMTANAFHVCFFGTEASCHFNR